MNNTKKGNAFLFVEKYRPQTIDDVQLPNKYKKFFNKIVKDNEVPNLLFHGSAGVGKCLHFESELEIEIDEEVYNQNKKFFKN